MKRLLCALFFLNALVSVAGAQRCGSFMSVVFLDKNGKPLANDSPYEVKLTAIDGEKPDARFVGTDVKKFKSIFFPTGCGILLAELEVAYQSKKMTLKIRRVPMDKDFSIEAPKFAKGVFEIDFENSLQLGKPETKKYVSPKDNSSVDYTVMTKRKWKKTE